MILYIISTNHPFIIQSGAMLGQGPGFDSGPGSFCVESACSPCSCWFPPGILAPPTVHRHASGVQLEERGVGPEQGLVGLMGQGTFTR